MKKAWKKLGIAAFWLCWPLLFLYLKGSTRTRLLVVVQDKVLVAKGWLGTDRWSLPGGGLRRGEDAATGAARELEEETGLVIDPKNLRFFSEGIARQYGLSFHFKAFIARLPGSLPVVRPRGEIIETQWISSKSLTPFNSAVDTYDLVQALLLSENLIQ